MLWYKFLVIVLGTSFVEQKFCTRTTLIYCYVPEKTGYVPTCSGTLSFVDIEKLPLSRAY